ncbi:MAG: HYR domain-containing protein [Anaerolineaceae bacterium]
MIRRAAAAALMLCVAATTTAFAESISTDADAVSAGDQTTIDLGSVAPGQDVAVDVMFRLDCSGTSHVDAGQSVRLSPGVRTIPPGGSYSVGSVTLTPGAGWPADGDACPIGLPGVIGIRHMVVTAPYAPGADLRYVFSWNRSLVPPTAGDADVLAGSNPTVTFILDVADNTPPVLILPGDFTVEGDTTGGAVAAYGASATDPEDATAPTPACSPVVGAVLPLGTTTVSCSATDSGGLTTTGSFDITVVDTTAPTLAGMPADQERTTGDPGGISLTYSLPTATDVVDPDPAIDCMPASGSLIPVGATTVTCTATDGAGNRSSDSFSVDVAFVRPVAWSVRWGEPVATDGGAFVAQRGRTIPVKVEIFADGVEQASGDVQLEVAACGGAVTLRTELIRDGGRWKGPLDTARLGSPGCYVATASLDGNVVGFFRLDLRGAAAAANRR